MTPLPAPQRCRGLTLGHGTTFARRGRKERKANGVSGARAIDNGTTGTTSRAILCFVSANNYLYPTTAPTGGPFTGAIWKD